MTNPDGPFLDDEFAEIDALSQHCIRALAALNGRIAEGRVPDADAIEAELAHVRRLRDLHDRVRGKAADFFGPAERPDPDLPIDDLAELVRRRRDSLRARLGNARRLLGAFLGVTASGPYMTAIEPLLARARALLSLTGSGDVDVDALEDRTMPMRLFLQAMRLADKNTDEAESLFARLDGFLPSTAARGLAMGHYAGDAAGALPADASPSEPVAAGPDTTPLGKPGAAPRAREGTPAGKTAAPNGDAPKDEPRTGEPELPNARITEPAVTAAGTRTPAQVPVPAAGPDTTPLGKPGAALGAREGTAAVTAAPNGDARKDEPRAGEPGLPNARIVKPVAAPPAVTAARTRTPARAPVSAAGPGLDTTLLGKLSAALGAKGNPPDASQAAGTKQAPEAQAGRHAKTSAAESRGTGAGPEDGEAKTAAPDPKDAVPDGNPGAVEACTDRTAPLMEPPAIDDGKVWRLECRFPDKTLQTMLRDVRRHPEKTGVFRVLLACGPLTKEHMLRIGRPKGFFDNVPTDKIRQAVDSLCSRKLLARVRNDGFALLPTIFMINGIDTHFQLLPPGQCTAKSEELSDRAAAEALACVDALMQCIDMRPSDMRPAKDGGGFEPRFPGPGRIMIRIPVGDGTAACRVVPPFLAAGAGESVLVPLPDRTEPGGFSPADAGGAVFAMCAGGGVFRLDGEAWTEIVPPVGAAPHVGRDETGGRSAGMTETPMPEVGQGKATPDVPSADTQVQGPDTAPRMQDTEKARTAVHAPDTAPGDDVPAPGKRPVRPDDAGPDVPASVFHPESLGMTEPDPSPAGLDEARGPSPVSDEAARLLALHAAPGSIPSDDELHGLALLSLQDARLPRVLHALPDGLADALLLLGSLPPGGADAYPLCTQLRDGLEAATGLLGDAQARAGFQLAGLFHGEGPADAACRLAAFMLALFRPATAHDYQLLKLARERLADFPCSFPGFGDCRGVFDMLAELAEAAPGGFTDPVLTALDDRGELEKERAALRGIARSLAPEPKFKTMLKGIPELSARLFGPSGLFGAFAAAAASGSPEADAMAAGITERFMVGEGKIDDAGLGAFLDGEWNAATAGLTAHARNVVGILRKKILLLLRERIELAVRWARLSAKTDERTVEALRGKRAALAEELRGALAATTSGSASYRVVVANALDRMLKTLTDRRVFVPPFAGLLRSGLFSVDGAGMPVIDHDTDGVRGFEPWRRALRHMADTTSTLASAFQAVSEDERSPMYDDLHRLELLGWCLGKDESEFRSSDDEAARAKQLTDLKTKRLRDELVMACTCGRIGESDKEGMLRTLAALHDNFFALRDFGQWGGLLKAVRDHADDLAKASVDRLRERLEEKAADLPEDMRPAIDRIRETLDGGNCAVAEDMLNRLGGDADGIDAPDDSDALADFLSEDVFDRLLGHCPRGGDSFKRRAGEWLDEAMPSGWTARQKKECRDLVQLWPDRAPRTGDEDRLATAAAGLFRHLCIDVTDERPAIRKCRSGYLVTIGIRGTAPHLLEYPHPFKEFGTKLRRLHVVVMFGGHDPKDIVEEISLLNLDGPAVLLIDHQLDRPARRQLAEACHRRSGLATFLMLDRVLFLHLAPRAETERLPLLLRCALPFAAPLQPFSQGSGSTDDEMFCGRIAELRSVLDPKGPCVVYGGRQLGKTALLQRAEKMFSRPADGKFAVFADIKDRADEASVTRKIVDCARDAAGRKLEDARRISAPQPAVAALRRIAELPECDGLDALCREFGGLSGEGGLKILLLIDEADAFLGAIAGEGYMSLNPLVELRRRTDDFKFVLAGLNNVCRARNAMADNGIFGQMGEPLCVSPLSPRDAFTLISRPLEYLGFRPESAELLPTVLASTNYYPGIIQLFGRTIVEALRTDYGTNEWSARANPPFPLTERLLGRIIASSDIQQAIRQKFRMTLDIDRGGMRHYYLLPLCVAKLSREHGPREASRGFTVAEIRGVADAYALDSVTGLIDDELDGLLDEMTRMGVLCRGDGDGANRYRFLRDSFLDIMGRDAEEIGKNLEGAAYEAMGRKEPQE